MKALTVDNVTYKSFAAAWRALGIASVSFALARKRVTRGWLPKKAFVTSPIEPQNRRAGITS